MGGWNDLWVGSEHLRVLKTNQILCYANCNQNMEWNTLRTHQTSSRLTQQWHALVDSVLLCLPTLNNSLSCSKAPSRQMNANLPAELCIYLSYYGCAVFTKCSHAMSTDLEVSSPWVRVGNLDQPAQHNNYHMTERMQWVLPNTHVFRWTPTHVPWQTCFSCSCIVVFLHFP